MFDESNDFLNWYSAKFVQMGRFNAWFRKFAAFLYNPEPFQIFWLFSSRFLFLCVCGGGGGGGGDTAEWFIVQIFFILPKCFAYENSRRLIGWKFLQTHSTINGDLREQRSFSGV